MRIDRRNVVKPVENLKKKEIKKNENEKVDSFKCRDCVGGDVYGKCWIYYRHSS